MPANNGEVICRFIEEAINEGQSELLAELIADDHVGHGPFGDHYGLEGMRIALADYRFAFPDLKLTVEDLMTVDDKVALRFTLQGTHDGPFMGIPPTGRVVTASGIAINHLVGGKLAESWVNLDALNLLRQIGASPVLQRTDSTSGEKGLEGELS